MKRVFFILVVFCLTLGYSSAQGYNPRGDNKIECYGKEIGRFGHEVSDDGHLMFQNHSNVAVTFTIEIGGNPNNRKTFTVPANSRFDNPYHVGKIASGRVGIVVVWVVPKCN